MKKLLLILLCLPFIGFGQTIIWSSDCSNPADWTPTPSNNSNFYNWSIKTDPFHYSFGNLNTTTATNGFLHVSSDLYPHLHIESTVTTANTIDLSNYQNVQISFQTFFRWWQDTRYFEISIDNGITWQIVGVLSQEWTYNSPSQTTPNPWKCVYDISSIAGGESEVLLRFYYNDNYMHGWDWSIDDIIISDVTSGCMDSLSINYDALALVDDGSCFTNSSIDTVIACDSYTWPLNAQTLNTSGLYIATSYPFGYMKVDSLFLTVNYNTSNINYIENCYSYNWPINNITYNSSGTYEVVTVNNSGCNHTETLHLSIIDSTINTTNEVACDSYLWPVNNITYESSGTYMYESINSSGCYGAEILNLTINNSDTNIYTVFACDSYTWPKNNQTYLSSGDYIILETDANGCDRMSILELTINNTPIVNIWQTGDELFALSSQNESIKADWYNIQTQNNLTRIWLMEEDTSTFSPTFDCSYFIIFEDEIGCIDTSDIYSYGANAARIGSFTASPNPTSGQINVSFENNKNQFVMLELLKNDGTKLDEFITIENNIDIDLSQYASGTYYLHFNSKDAIQGCRLEEVQKLSTKIILNK